MSIPLLSLSPTGVTLLTYYTLLTLHITSLCQELERLKPPLSCIPNSLRFSALIFETQELPKLLRGYHKCSKDDAARLAGLIYRVRFGDSKSEFAAIP